VYFQAGVTERPQWYESNKPLLDEYDVDDRPHEWDARWWSPISTAEHLALRDRVGIVDLSAFVTFDVTGPGALDYVQRMVVNQVDKPVGSAIYTPVLNQHGGFRSDLTVKRLGEDHFRIVTGAFDGPRDEYWFRKHLPVDGSVTFTDTSKSMVTIGVWGPHAREVLSSITDDDLSNEGFPYGTTAEVDFGGIRTRMLRISYVGELGWEVYVGVDDAVALWDEIWNAGEPHGIVPVGGGVYGTTGRLEKGYRLMGAELESEYTPVEAGLARPRVKSADFIGKEAYLKARETGPVATLCTFTVDDHMSVAGIPRYMTGGEPIVDADGDRIVDAHGRISIVTTAGMGPSVGKYLLLGYLPSELAVEGASFGVKYMNEIYPITVAVAGSTPLFDPDDTRMKG
jgi:glycine cleavage system aminomethyltransferase T